MKRLFRAITLPALALGALLSSGCGQSTTNEEGLVTTKAAPVESDIPVFKTYGERQLYENEQAAKKRAAAKGKVAPKAPPKASQEAPAETPKESPKPQ
jgi:hypothetical protein